MPPSGRGSRGSQGLGDPLDLSEMVFQVFHRVVFQAQGQNQACFFRQRRAEESRPVAVAEEVRQLDKEAVSRNPRVPRRQVMTGDGLHVDIRQPPRSGQPCPDEGMGEAHPLLGEHQRKPFLPGELHRRGPIFLEAGGYGQVTEVMEESGGEEDLRLLLSHFHSEEFGGDGGCYGMDPEGLDCGRFAARPEDAENAQTEGDAPDLPETQIDDGPVYGVDDGRWSVGGAVGYLEELGGQGRIVADGLLEPGQIPGVAAHDGKHLLGHCGQGRQGVEPAEYLPAFSLRGQLDYIGRACPGGWMGSGAVSVAHTFSIGIPDGRDEKVQGPSRRRIIPCKGRRAGANRLDGRFCPVV